MHNENDPFSNVSHKCCALVFNKTKRYVLFVRFSTKLKQTTNRSKRVNIDCTLYQSRIGCKKNQFKQATLLFRVRTDYNGGKKKPLLRKHFGHYPSEGEQILLDLLAFGRRLLAFAANEFEHVRWSPHSGVLYTL